MDAARRPPRTSRRWLWAIAALLVASNVVALLRGTPPVETAADEIVQLPAVGGEGDVDVAYWEVDGDRERPTVVLLHGSPGSSSDFAPEGRGASSAWARSGRRVLAIDLPGFGESTVDVPDYSVAAHAEYVLALADELDVERMHLVGFSMGGGVILELAERAPERVASLALVSAIGVQELELFGDHRMNHMVHGAQLLGLRAMPWIVPHFGALNGSMLSVPYARNFYDTDQRPLRGILERWEKPLLIVHGETDFLVPPEAAIEHERVVPHSELVMLPTGHFHPFMEPGLAPPYVFEFLDRVEAGTAPTRATADPVRVAAASAPFDPTSIPSLAGPALLVALILIALSTLVSEDLACIATGLLVADGRLPFVAGAGACFVGIFFGDVGLYVMGRFLGRPALGRAPLRWFVSEAAVERASEWFRTRGGRVIFASRFLPGSRFPTYVAAGMLGQSFLAFSLWFVAAGLLWTPLLVLFATWAGEEAIEAFGAFERFALPAIAAIVVGLLVVQRLAVPLFTHKGRRQLAGRWRRIRSWEFWPPYVFYVPVVVYVAWLALRHRSLALVTAVNPGIPTGGFIGESKSAILHALGDDGGKHVARFRDVRVQTDPEERVAAARAFAADHGLPVVLKPDVGQRGSGVRILRDEASLESAVRDLVVDSVLQEFAPGREYGLFYVRRPSEERGRIFSITEKEIPSVVGDGERTLEQLILDDPRAVALAQAYLDANAGHVLEVVPAGEERQLVELGTHCRGAIFLDGRRHLTPELEEATEKLSRRFEGFYFGRYDVISDGPEALARGEFRAIELNGVTSEATHIYDPRTGLREAYRVLFEQWRLAYEIAAECRDRGAKAASVGTLVREYLSYRRLQRGHAPAGVRSASGAPEAVEAG